MPHGLNSKFKVWKLKKRTYIRLFEHLYVEIANIPSCSAFGYTNRSEKKQKYLIPLSTL